MQNMWRLFIAPIIVSIITLCAVWHWGGVAALSLAFFLAILEISLSFDNAVINAKVLSRMSELWRQRFLTWGMLISVLGARLLLPMLIVALAAHMSPLFIAYLVLADPVGYAHLVSSIEPTVYSFGAAFLMMVSLKYFFNETKEVHWISGVERRLVAWGRVNAVEVLVTLAVLLGMTLVLPGEALTILSAGVVGIILFILMEGVVEMLGASASALARGGVGLFLYINLLDAAFSLDGVIGAFALTSQVLIIVAGLGIGAYFVRSLTILLVRKRTLATLVYLEHGAYWAIFALSLCMFIGLARPVPDAIVALVSILFIGSAYLSSLRAQGAKVSESL